MKLWLHPFYDTADPLLIILNIFFLTVLEHLLYKVRTHQRQFKKKNFQR